MKSTEADTYYFDSLEEASQSLCREVLMEAVRTVKSYGDFRLVLAGGSTPVRLYEMLATEAGNPGIPWQNIHIFWSDERFLPPYQKNSNFYLASRTLLSKAPFVAENIHQVPVWESTVREAARKYDEMLRKYAAGSRPLFDFTLLGMGEDGHIASLFPGHPVLDDETGLVRAVAESAGQPPVPRVTLTLAGLARSSRICFLITGEQKKDVMKKIKDGDWEGIYPAARVRALDRLEWFAV
ncbi:MAG: 6-phosphogluconolactonase [Desulfurivibrionaceae bacterium]